MILQIKNLSLSYGNNEVLNIDELFIPKNSITGLLGPSGSGKSTFINAILKQNPSPSFRQTGEIFLEKELLTKKSASKNISFISQKARLYTGTIIQNLLDGISFKKGITEKKKKQFIQKYLNSLGLWEVFKNILNKEAIQQSLGVHKLLLLAREMLKQPKLILIDEVLANTSIKDETLLMELVKRLKKTLSIILITHNKSEAKDVCDYIALVSGGILHEFTSKKEFFIEPKTNTGKDFLESGSAWYFNPNKSQFNKEDNLTALRRFSSINEFYWVSSERLGGMQRPGLMTNIDSDLKIMKQLGVEVLVSTTQTPIDKILLNKYGIHGIHFPIVDMSIPSFNPSVELFKKLDKFYTEGKSVVFHCKAGMGRTGTMLACNLIWLEGLSAINAIEKIRHANHKYIQTEEQIEFISMFEQELLNKKERC